MHDAIDMESNTTWFQEITFLLRILYLHIPTLGKEKKVKAAMGKKSLFLKDKILKMIQSDLVFREIPLFSQ